MTLASSPVTASGAGGSSGDSAGSRSPGSPFWISDNNAGVSTLYNVPGANNTPVSINPLVVSIPTPGDPLGASGTPTGTVFNIDGGATGGFTVSGVDKNGNPITASAAFLFATEDGTLVGWNPAVNPTDSGRRSPAPTPSSPWTTPGITSRRPIPPSKPGRSTRA